jgi:hypothetical protein
MDVMTKYTVGVGIVVVVAVVVVGYLLLAVHTGPAKGSSSVTISLPSTTVSTTSIPVALNSTNTITTVPTTSIPPAGSGGCPCLNKTEIASLLGIPQSEQQGAGFGAVHISNSDEKVQLQAITFNALSASQLQNITQGWFNSYQPKTVNDIMVKLYRSRIIQTSGANSLVSALASSVGGGQILSQGTADSMNYSYFWKSVKGGNEMLLVGYKGEYVVDLSITVPTPGNSISPVGAIAQNLSASLG